MELGYFAMPSHPPECGLKEGHEWDLQVLRWLDELGYQEAWIGEHTPHPGSRIRRPTCWWSKVSARPGICASAPAVSCCPIITRPSLRTASRCSITSPRAG